MQMIWLASGRAHYAEKKGSKSFSMILFSASGADLFLMDRVI